MDKVITVQPQEMAWQSHKPAHNPDEVAYPGGKVPQWDGPVKVRYKELMRSDTARVVVAEWDPSHHEPTHCHPRDEYMFIFDGSATLNGKKLEAGGFFFIAKDTFYNLVAGPNGLKFFRVTV